MGCVTLKNGDLPGLDNAINMAADEIKTDLPQGTKVAVIMFSSSTTKLSEYIMEELSLALGRNKKLVIVDRKQLELIRNEINFQMSGEVDDNAAVHMGRMLGAEYIITGSLVDVGTYYRFRASAVNVESAVRAAPVSLLVNKSDKQIAHLGKNEDETVNSQDNNILRGIWESETEIDEQIAIIVFLGKNEFIFTMPDGQMKGTYDDKKLYKTEDTGLLPWRDTFEYKIVDGKLFLCLFYGDELPPLYEWPVFIKK
jgi:TolB-like protein